MTVCTLIYNASTGSDTAASGSNAPTAAVTGTNGDTTGSPATITLNETVDFTAGSGVLDDNTDVVWVDTPAGDRHLFRISSFTGGAATCTALVCFDNASNTVTGDSWAVGGIRRSFDNDATNNDFQDVAAGWEFSLQDTADFAIGTGTTPITLPAIGDLTDGPFRIVAASGDSPVITWTEDTYLFGLPANVKLYVSGVTMNNTTSTNSSASAFRVTGANVNLTVVSCACNCDGAFVHQAASVFHLVAISCDVQGCASTTGGFFFGNDRGYYHIEACSIHNHSGVGIFDQASSGFGGGSILGNVIRDCAAGGIRTMGNRNHMSYAIQSNVFHDNTGPGLEIVNTLNLTGGPFTVLNNIFTGNSTYGIRIVTPTSDEGGSLIAYEDFNAFRGNTSGETSGLVQGSNDVTLSADPYTAVGSDDYSLNSTAGGGAACADAGFGRTS